MRFSGMYFENWGALTGSASTLFNNQYYFTLLHNSLFVTLTLSQMEKMYVKNVLLSM